MSNLIAHRRSGGAIARGRQSSMTAVLLLVLCGVSAPALGSRLVFLAEQDFAFVNELHLVDLAEPGRTTRLNRPLSPFSHGVGSFAVSPDGARIAFSADQDVAGDPDLYVVDITALGTWNRVGNLAPGHAEAFAKFSPDGQKVAFTASDPAFGEAELYVVDLALPREARRINGSLTEGGSVSLTGFEFTPDGSRIVYTASELERKYELYVVDLAEPGRSVRLNAPGGSAGDSFEGRFAILEDSNRVIYSAVGARPGVRELHLVAMDVPAQPITLNAPLQNDGDIFDFTVSSDGRHRSYTDPATCRTTARSAKPAKTARELGDPIATSASQKGRLRLTRPATRDAIPHRHAGVCGQKVSEFLSAAWTTAIACKARRQVAITCRRGQPAVDERA